MARAKSLKVTGTEAGFDTEFKDVNEVINELEINKASILQKAFDEGGRDMVVELVNEIETLKDTRFELIRTILDKNNAGYKQLSDNAIREARSLNADVKRLEAISKVLNGLSSVIGLLGRILVRFAI